MKITKLLAIALLPSLWSYTQAQEQTTEPTTSAEAAGEEAVSSPLKNKVSLAATLSYNNYLTAPAPAPALSHAVAAPVANWTEKNMLVGVDGNWFFSNTWKLNFSAGFNFTKNPGYSKKTGVGTVIPEYATVPSSHSLGAVVSLGADRYFHAKSNQNFVWYVGPRVGFAYVNSAANYEEAYSQAEAFNARIAATVGADYYLVENTFFVGVQIDPLAYTYGVHTIKPQPNVGSRSADNHNFSVLAAPTLKIGFTF
ncbi:BT1926 family outer membrane beta-barrel protein [Capnocytophaga granulosa]